MIWYGTITILRPYSPVTDRSVASLPDRPNFVFCGTDLSFGVNWIFGKTQTGDYQAGHLSSVSKNWNLSFAVAASSCFPPVFKPLSLGERAQELEPAKFPQGQARDEYLKHLRLSDGGVYDNLALEPIWNTQEVALCSHGGRLFGFSFIAWLLSRASQVRSCWARRCLECAQV